MLLDGKTVNACLILSEQAAGHAVQTVELLGEHPEQGWKPSPGLHPLQAAFVENGAIQCGYCTPAQILAAYELLVRNPDPSEDEVRQALSGVLCRCTGYIKPVQAVLQAAKYMREGTAHRLDEVDFSASVPLELPETGTPVSGGGALDVSVMPRIQLTAPVETESEAVAAGGQA